MINKMQYNQIKALLTFMEWKDRIEYSPLGASVRTLTNKDFEIIYDLDDKIPPRILYNLGVKYIDITKSFKKADLKSLIKGILNQIKEDEKKQKEKEKEQEKELQELDEKLFLLDFLEVMPKSKKKEK